MKKALGITAAVLVTAATLGYVFRSDLQFAMMQMAIKPKTDFADTIPPAAPDYALAQRQGQQTVAAIHCQNIPPHAEKGARQSSHHAGRSVGFVDRFGGIRESRLCSLSNYARFG